MIHALAFIKSGDYEDALEELNFILENEPENEKALSLRTEAYFMLNDYKNAYKDSKKLVEKYPKPQNLIYKAETECELEMYADAIKDCKRALNYSTITEVESFACWNLLAVSYSESEMYEESIKYYNLVLEKYKAPEAYYERALSYLYLNNFENALADFEKSIEGVSQYSKEYQQKFYTDDFYYYYGLSLLGTKRIDQALANFSKVKKNSDYPKLNDYIQFCKKNKSHN